jgi:hypothetical protein
MFVCPSVRLRRTNRFPLEGFLWNFIFESFSKFCWENSSFFKFWQENQVLYTKITIHLWSYPAEFSSEWKAFHTEVAEKIRTHILCSITFFFFSKIVALRDIVQPDRSQMTIRRMHIACCTPMATNTQSEYVILTAFPLHEWLPELAPLLHYTYTASLVKTYE